MKKHVPQLNDGGLVSLAASSPALQSTTSAKKLALFSLLILVLFQLVVKFGTDALFRVSAPLDAHVHVIKQRQTTLAARNFDI